MISADHEKWAYTAPMVGQLVGPTTDRGGTTIDGRFRAIRLKALEKMRNCDAAGHNVSTSLPARFLGETFSIDANRTGKFVENEFPPIDRSNKAAKLHCLLHPAQISEGIA